MESQLIEVGNRLGISAKDIEIISDCISAFPTNDLFANTHFIERVFLNDIKPGHYLMLGYLNGYLIATENAFNEIYNSFKPCQRVN